MKWQLKDPTEGDIIRVAFGGSLYHYGIYVSDTEVIQFGLIPTRRSGISDADITVCISDIDVFLNGGFLEVGEPDVREALQKRAPREIVDFARSKIGMTGYNILYNNCEHFANECYFGKGFSSQADSVREMFRKMPIVDLYLAAIPEAGEPGEIFPPERRREIESVTNERVRREKYYAWKLLEYGLCRSLGLKIDDMEFEKTPFGKWTSPSCHFSISHSHGIVAVAVSRDAVGVDVEPLVKPVSDRFADRIFSECEREVYSSLPEDERLKYLISAWTVKEAVFKTTDKECFIPSEICIADSRVSTTEIVDGGMTYLVSVATPTPDRIRIYRDVSLK